MDRLKKTLSIMVVGIVCLLMAVNQPTYINGEGDRWRKQSSFSRP